MKDYKIDFSSKTLTITRAFADAAADPASKEYKLIQRFQKDIPDLTIVHRTHRTPSVYRNNHGMVSRCYPYKNLTYENMEGFINALPRRNELMEVYNLAKESIAAPQTSRYAFVRRWFLAQFPFYRYNPFFYLNNDFEIIGIDAIREDTREAA